MLMYDHYFSNFGRPPLPDDLCKDSATRHPWFWRRFLIVFTIYGHGGHLGQKTTTILAILGSPNLRRLHMKLEQNWAQGIQRRGRVKMLMEGWTDAQMDGQWMKSDHYSSS